MFCGSVLWAVFKIPGYLDNTQWWTARLAMSEWPIIPSVVVLVGLSGLAYSTGLFGWSWKGISRLVTLSTQRPASRVPTSVDPEQSQVSYDGPSGLRVEVFLTTENHLDVEVRLRKLTLEIKTAKERLNCRFLAFQPDPFSDFVKMVGDVAVPGRRAIKGWAWFQYKDGIRIADFRRFLFRAQAIGEPEQAYAFEPYDWGHAKEGQSKLVMLSLNDD